MKKIILLIIAINLFNCQKKEVKYTSPPLPIEAVTLNNNITPKHVNIPNTKIYFLPFDKNYKLSNGAMISNDNNYSITVMESDGNTVKNTVDDFSKEGFEAKGIKVFDDKFITVNGVKSKIVFLQGQPQLKGAILFIDNKTEKEMITVMYDANNILLENKVKNMLHTIVYNKDSKIDYLSNATFKIDLSDTKFKFQKYTSNFYNFTEAGKNVGILEPNILISQIPNIENPSLKSFFEESKKSLLKYGFEDLNEKNIIETKDSFQAEIYGKFNGKPSVCYYKIIKDPKKDFILFLMASSKQNLDQDLPQFKKVGNTFSFK
ncbi:hypothetical protein [Chryseobacterium indologenes]|uniref:hypothetical protein n=1 Tax=Chryseobacterium indologenes TaxID=253 RepID=UPI001BCC61D2|nr:hypothetical protein [Chryseobacterium indologenes]